MFWFKKMNKFKLSAVSFFAFIFLMSFGAAAQDSRQSPTEANNPEPIERPNNRVSLLRELNLTPDQVRQIREINRETREQMRAAAQRQRGARRALDAAIYAEKPIQTEIDRRTSDLAAAQAELTKLRAATESRIRQVLNSEQFARFRELRRQNLERQQNEPRPFPPRENRRRRKFPARNNF